MKFPSRIIFLVFVLLLTTNLFSAESFSDTTIIMLEGNVAVFDYLRELIPVPEETRVGMLIEKIDEYTAKVEVSGKIESDITLQIMMMTFPIMTTGTQRAGLSELMGNIENALHIIFSH